MKLEGLRVLDLSLFLPGPHLSMMMADHGAEVIHVEPPGGEPARHIGIKEDGVSVWFRTTHRGKKSMVIDLKEPDQREALLRLCETADVFLEAFRPGVMDRLGVGPDVVRKRNPAIVYCSISAFGQTGPNRLKPAHDLAIQALSGTLSVNLGSDGKPALTGTASADITSSLMALSGILMALYRREKTGRGDYLDLSMQDALMSWTSHVMGPPFGERRAAVPQHERHWGGGAFYNIYETADAKHIALGGSEPKFVRSLLTALGGEGLIELALQPPGPVQDPVKHFLAESFRARSLSDWELFLADVDVCWAPVNDLYEAVCDAHVRERGMVFEDDDGKLHFANPMQFTDEPARLELTVPELGEHTEELLKEVL